MKGGLKSLDLVSAVTAEINSMLSRLKPGQPKRPCLFCGVMFEPTRDDNVFHTPACGRRSHYLRFSVREIRKARKEQKAVA